MIFQVRTKQAVASLPNKAYSILLFVVAEAAKAFDLSLPKFLANSATDRPRDFENCCSACCTDECIAGKHALGALQLRKQLCDCLLS